MTGKEVLAIYGNLLGKPDTSIYSAPLEENPISEEKYGVRPNSASIEDAFFGDSGKGSAVAKFNRELVESSERHRLVTIRYNGGGNSGHESVIDGKKICTHQLPMGIAQEGATAVITRGVLLHPEDLVGEIEEIRGKFGGSLPGNLIIDERAPLGLDTHRALEAALNSHNSGGRGSTGRGIAPGYASVYERTAVTVKDLMGEKWEFKLREHYRLYQGLTQGLQGELADIEVVSMASGQPEKRKVGTEAEFIDRLRESRQDLSGYVSPNVFFLLQEAWQNEELPFTLESAQGPGLDPFHGVYPDVTASRPMTRNINDSTYNVVLPEEIAFRGGVMKTTYLSSVGQRRLPSEGQEEWRKWVQQAFDEKGRSTGRLRDIYEVSIPIAQYLREAAGYEYLVATHLDASREDIPVRVVTHYTDRTTGEEMPYLPYQDHLDRLVAHTVGFPGWDGEAVKKAQSPKDLPQETRLYLAFLSRTIAPVAFGTTGPELGSYVSWLPKF